MSATENKLTSREPGLRGRLPQLVLAGGALGILAGIVFGEQTEILAPVGRIYASLMQVVVFPYLICALLHGLGRLSPETARRLFKSSWLIYLLIWAATLAALYILSIAIPPAPHQSFIDARIVSDDTSLLDLLIPSNPFAALTNNFVPAVVLFAVIFGVALQRVDGKEAILPALDAIRNTCLVFWGFMLWITPLGVFALIAVTAGTTKPSELLDLTLFLLVVFAGCLFLTFWILPSLISGLSALTVRQVVGELQSAFVVALVTGLPVAALPFVQQAALKLAAGLGGDERERAEIIDTSLAISFPMAQVGNLFVWPFIILAGSYFAIPFEPGKQAALPFLTLVSTFGASAGTIAAVDFLGDWLALPDHTTELYIGLSSVAKYPRAVVSVMGFAFITILATLNFYGHLRPAVPRLVVSLAVSALLVGGVATIGHLIGKNQADARAYQYSDFELNADTIANVTVRNADERIEAAASAGSGTGGGNATPTMLERIHRTGVLRVGYHENNVPYSYRNARGALVGFDIAYAYRLAHHLGVDLQLVPFHWRDLEKNLEAGRFDLAASSIYLTRERMERLSVTAPYHRSPVTLIVRGTNSDAYRSRHDIEAVDDLTIGALEHSFVEHLAREVFPSANLVLLANYTKLEENRNIDVTLWPLEQARAWVSSHPDFSAIVPRDLGVPFLLAYVMPDDADRFRLFMNYWLSLQRADGFHRKMVEKWLHGHRNVSDQPRWCVARDLFGWDFD